MSSSPLISSVFPIPMTISAPFGSSDGGHGVVILLPGQRFLCLGSYGDAERVSRCSNESRSTEAASRMLLPVAGGSSGGADEAVIRSVVSRSGDGLWLFSPGSSSSSSSSDDSSDEGSSNLLSSQDSDDWESLSEPPSSSPACSSDSEVSVLCFFDGGCGGEASLAARLSLDDGIGTFENASTPVLRRGGCGVVWELLPSPLAFRSGANVGGGMFEGAGNDGLIQGLRGPGAGIKSFAGSSFLCFVRSSTAYAPPTSSTPHRARVGSLIDEDSPPMGF
jgi:hypothetical protein